MPHLGDFVQAERRVRHWSQKKLGEEAGVPQKTVGGIERGRLPYPATLPRLQKAFAIEGEILASLYIADWEEREGIKTNRFGRWLKTKRLAAGLTATQILPGNTGYISFWERGRFLPSWENADACADFFQTSREAVQKMVARDRKERRIARTLPQSSGRRLGNLVANLRIEKGLTQRQLIVKLGWAPPGYQGNLPFLSLIEKGRTLNGTRPGRRVGKVLLNLARCLNVNPDGLFRAFLEDRHERMGRTGKICPGSVLLFKTRTLRNLTRRKAARKAHIGYKILSALEEFHLENLPSLKGTKGALRNLAKVLDLSYPRLERGFAPLLEELKKKEVAKARERFTRRGEGTEDGLAWKIIQARTESGLSLGALGERVGVTKQMIHLIESGKVSPKAPSVARVIKFLKIEQGRD